MKRTTIRWVIVRKYRRNGKRVFVTDLERYPDQPGWGASLLRAKLYEDKNTALACIGYSDQESVAKVRMTLEIQPQRGKKCR